MPNLELSFVTQRDLGSWAIRWFTHSDFSHVDIITPDGYRIGARSDCPVNQNLPTDPIKRMRTGVQKRPMNYAPFTRDVRLVIPCSPTQADYANDWLLDQIGKPYDSTGLFRSFLFDDVDWRNEDSWWCSELGCVFLEKASFPPCRTPANRMAPNDTFIYGGCFVRRVYDGLTGLDIGHDAARRH